MSNNREHGERRLFGALLSITNGNSLLAIKDTNKIEMSGLISPDNDWYFDSSQSALGLPGGGRGVTNENRQETLYQTLFGELREEFAPISLPYFRERIGAHKLIHPFAAAQLKEGQAIHQFGVTSISIPFTSFTKKDQREMHELVEKEQAFWMSIGLLFQIAKDAKPNEFQYHNLPIRPQLLAVALINCLEEMVGETSTIKHIHKGNKNTVEFVREQSSLLRLPIKNGTFESDGSVTPHLKPSDKQFLLRQYQ